MNQMNRQTRIHMFSVSKPKGKRSLVIRIRICDSRYGLKNDKNISKASWKLYTFFVYLYSSVLFECWFISEGTKEKECKGFPHFLLFWFLFRRISFRLLFFIKRHFTSSLLHLNSRCFFDWSLMCCLLERMDANIKDTQLDRKRGEMKNKKNGIEDWREQRVKAMFEKKRSLGSHGEEKKRC